jgi:hypothetical protein
VLADGLLHQTFGIEYYSTAQLSVLAFAVGTRTAGATEMGMSSFRSRPSLAVWVVAHTIQVEHSYLSPLRPVICSVVVLPAVPLMAS